MSERVTIELPDELSRRARRLAAAGNRRLEDAVIDWIDRAVTDPDVETLPDDELLRLCDATLEAGEQAELSDRLGEAREGTLDTAGPSDSTNSWPSTDAAWCSRPAPGRKW